MIRENKRIIVIGIAIVGLLLIPLIAMQFTDEVKWKPFDFIVGGVLLLGIGLGCEFVFRKVSKIEHRIAICAGLLVAFLLIWAELAVGIFNTPLSGS